MHLKVDTRTKICNKSVDKVGKQVYNVIMKMRKGEVRKDSQGR